MARDKGDEAKVVSRWLYIGEQRYNSENIPEDLVQGRNGNEFWLISSEHKQVFFSASVFYFSVTR